MKNGAGLGKLMKWKMQGKKYLPMHISQMQMAKLVFRG